MHERFATFTAPPKEMNSLCDFLRQQLPGARVAIGPEDRSIVLFADKWVPQQGSDWEIAVIAVVKLWKKAIHQRNKINVRFGSLVVSTQV